MYIWDFSRSEGAGKATTRKTRGLQRSVIARMVPPLPAASRPSKTMTIRCPVALTQSCTRQSSVCRRRSSFSYSLRLSFAPDPAGGGAFFALPFASFFAAIECPSLPAAPLPGEEDADVAQTSVRIVQNLRPGFESQRLQLRLEEFMGLFGKSLQGIRPVMLGIVDAPALVVAEAGREGHHLDLVQ